MYFFIVLFLESWAMFFNIFGAKWVMPIKVIDLTALLAC